MNLDLSCGVSYVPRRTKAVNFLAIRQVGISLAIRQVGHETGRFYSALLSTSYLFVE